MIRSRSFSIYLLKDGWNETNALRDDHKLSPEVQADSLPRGASLFVMDTPPRAPWWRGYFGVRAQLNQTFKGAIVFLPVEGRVFALSFGHVRHNLKEGGYEYDFGLRVTLNCVDPDRIKNTDVLDPGAARRQRTQVSVDSDLTYFDLDRDSTVLRSLTGKVAPEYADVIGHVTGAMSLRFSSRVRSDELPKLCATLLGIYRRDDYKTTFPGLHSIVPVRDPVVIDALNARALVALKERDPSVALGVPDLIEYRDTSCFRFFGMGGSEVYDDVAIDLYYEYLESRNSSALESMVVEDLKRHQLALTGVDGRQRIKQYSIFRSLVFDTMLDGDESRTYYLSEGHWYAVGGNYVERLDDYLDRFCVEVVLPDYNHRDEEEYNRDVAVGCDAMLCLDRANFAPSGETPMEPCDLYYVADGEAVFAHIKRWRSSGEFSHLVNQGVNAIRLLKGEGGAVGRLKAVIAEKVAGKVRMDWEGPLERGAFRVLFGIVADKDVSLGSKNLPLFSRISLRRGIQELRPMGVSVGFGFIRDASPQVIGRKVPRKSNKVARRHGV